MVNDRLHVVNIPNVHLPQEVTIKIVQDKTTQESNIKSKGIANTKNFNVDLQTTDAVDEAEAVISSYDATFVTLISISIQDT